MHFSSFILKLKYDHIDRSIQILYRKSSCRFSGDLYSLTTVNAGKFNKYLHFD